jgi:hypothetical protein
MFQFITIISVNSTSRHTTYGMAQILSTQVLLVATLPLADNIDATDRSANLHHFLYARAPGVYHANVIYTGSGKRDYDNRPLNKTVRSCEPSVFICHVILRLNDPSRGLRRALSPVSIRLRRDAHCLHLEYQRSLRRSALAGRGRTARSWRIVTENFIMLSGRLSLMSS